jgi:regulator of replication initiation timing
MAETVIIPEGLYHNGVYTTLQELENKINPLQKQIDDKLKRVESMRLDRPKIVKEIYENIHSWNGRKIGTRVTNDKEIAASLNLSRSHQSRINELLISRTPLINELKSVKESIIALKKEISRTSNIRKQQLRQIEENLKVQADFFKKQKEIIEASKVIQKKDDIPEIKKDVLPTITGGIGIAALGVIGLLVLKK